MLQTLRALGPTVWLLGVISLLNDTSSELIYPLIPLYLATALAVDSRTLGLIEGVALTVSSLLKLFSGVLVDRSRTAKGWVIGGYVLAALSRPLYALAASWPFAFLLRLMDRAGKGLRSSPRDALLAWSVAPQQRGLAFGFHRAMDNAGAVLGPLIAAVLLRLDVSLHDIFLWTALPGLLTVLLAVTLKEPAKDFHAEPFNWRIKDFPPAFRRYLLAVGLFTLGYPSNMFLLLRAGDLGVPRFEIPLLWATVALSTMLGSTHLSALSDRVGRAPLIMGGWLVYAGFSLALALDHDQVWALWVLFPLFGLYFAATEGPEKALVADLVDKNRLGTAFGWFHLVSGLMLLPASLLFGALWDWIGAEAAFGFSALCALAATALLASRR